MAKKNSAKLTHQGGYWAFVDETPRTESADNPNETSSSSTSETLVHHPRFFFDNVLVAIQIEKTLFNVHKYQLTKSEVFSDMFKMPKPKGDKPEEGSSPEHPIVIRGVAASDFAALLTVLYASHFSSNQPSSEAALVIPAFRLANMFDFSDLRAYLLPLAEENLEDVDKIVFAREFGIKEWLAPAFIRLCKREAVLSTEEARKLGADSVLLIWRMREQHRSRSNTGVVGSLYCQACTGMTYHAMGSYTCQGCRTSQNRCPFFAYNGPGAVGAKDSVDITTLEAEVKKWVEDDYATKG